MSLITPLFFWINKFPLDTWGVAFQNWTYLFSPLWVSVSLAGVLYEVCKRIKNVKIASILFGVIVASSFWLTVNFAIILKFGESRSTLYDFFTNIGAVTVWLISIMVATWISYCTRIGKSLF